MKLLLDTHILYWVLNNDPKLSVRARQLILNPENEIYYSIISAWETAVKHAKHPGQMAFSGVEFMDLCVRAGYRLVPVTGRYIAALESLSRPEDAPPHRDPFDRMLIAQAKADHMGFLTHDALLPFYNEHCIIPV